MSFVTIPVHLLIYFFSVFGERFNAIYCIFINHVADFHSVIIYIYCTFNDGLIC